MLKWGLRVKILLSVGVIIFIVLGTSTIVHIRGVQQDYLEAMQWRSQALAQSLIKKARELANTTPDFSSNDLLELLSYWVKDVYESNTHLTHIAAIDTNGMVAAHTDKTLWDTPVRSPGVRQALERRDQSTVLDDTTYHMLFPIMDRQDRYLGSIDIGIPKEIIDVQAQQILGHSMGLFVFFVGLAFIATSVSGHLLTQPIHHLVSIARELAEGNLAQPIVITNRSDEIGVLARSFAHMRDRIKQQIEDLQRLNDELEQRVEQRTAELAREKYIVDTFLANVPDSIYFKDREGRILRANKAHARQTGFANPLQEIGKTDFDFFAEEEAHSRYDREQDIMRTGQPLLDLEEREAGGHWVLTTKMPLRNEHDEIIGTFGISRDITALKQAQRELTQYRDHLEELVAQRTAELTRTNARLEEEIAERTRIEQVLRVSEEQYRMLAESVKDGIAIIQNKQFVFANKALAAMTGYPLENLMQTNPMKLFHDRAIQEANARLTPELSERLDQVWQSELTAKSGHAIWTEIEPTVIVWNDQSARLLNIRDITVRKRREQRLEEERVRLKEENLHLKSTIKDRYRFGPLIGKSRVMQQVYELLVNAAAAEVNIWVCGESGTGKELIARTLHQVSRRSAKPFIAVNCASIPETLFEREFFGHCKSAFTGAGRGASGLFDRAHQGTLFLDEVTELSPGTQAKLLRVLQDGEYTPLGSTTSKKANVVIVAATNRNCQEEIERERLRKDFFYRIGVIEIAVSPLRERKEDLALLIEHILGEYRKKHTQARGNAVPDLPIDQTMLPAELVQSLYSYDWPGNIRELQNVLQRYLVTRDSGAVLPLMGTDISPRRAILYAENLPLTLPEAVQTLEKRMITHALTLTRNRIGKTAEKLGMPVRTLQYKIKKYQLLLKN